MKTIEQWFNELPEPYRSQALENTLNLNGEKITGEEILKVHEPNIRQALSSAFIWADTPKEQGRSYWYNLYKTL